MTDDAVDEYQELQRTLKRNLGTIHRDNDIADERVRFSGSNHPDQHPTVIEAAIFERQDRREGSSKYRTFMSRSLESSRGRSTVNDGDFAETYCDAVEWIAEKSAEFDGWQIDWLELPKVILENDE